jgi:GDPmannose 4,6-dehydratase
MWKMLQQDQSQDFVLASGLSCSVRSFAQEVFERTGLAVKWQGEGLDEVAILLDTGRVVVRISPEYYRPFEVDELLGDASNALRELGWCAKISRSDIIDDMIAAARYLYEPQPLSRVAQT